MNDRQKAVVAMLRADRRRDLYEGGTPDGKRGTGQYYVTYSAGVKYTPLRNVEVDWLLRSGVIERKWPDVEMYVLK